MTQAVRVERRPGQRCFEDVIVDEALPELVKGPLTLLHLVRWSAATENWHRIHYDRDYATNHDKLPDVLVNGSLKQQFILQLLKDWAGLEGWAYKARFQFRAMDTVGATLRVWGKVSGKQACPDYGMVRLTIGMSGRDGAESVRGEALVALPYRDGSAVPYPFVPPSGDLFGRSW